MRATEALKIQAEDPKVLSEQTLRDQQDALNILTMVPEDKATKKVQNWPNEEPQAPFIEDQGKHKEVFSSGTNGQVIELPSACNVIHAELEGLKLDIKEATIRKMFLENELRKAIGRNSGGTLANGEKTYTNELEHRPARFVSGSSSKVLRAVKTRPVTR